MNCLSTQCNARKRRLANIYYFLFLRHVQQFQPFVEFLFFVIYYHAMILIGTYIFVMLHVEISTASAMLVSAICAYLIKCYFWCHVINSFQDIVSNALWLRREVCPFFNTKHRFIFRTKKLSYKSWN